MKQSHIATIQFSTDYNLPNFIYTSSFIMLFGFQTLHLYNAVGYQLVCGDVQCLILTWNEKLKREIGKHLLVVIVTWPIKLDPSGITAFQAAGVCLRNIVELATCYVCYLGSYKSFILCLFC